MLKGKKILALINARGGSKGVPGKNIKLMCGLPLIAYSIQSAKNSKYIDNLIVSTDDVKIADIAKSYGADVPFIRPSELATDKTKQIDVMVHAVNFLEDRGMHYDYICVLQPTCPMRTSDDIDGSLKLLVDSKSDSVITITNVGGRHPRTLYKKNSEDNRLSAFIESEESGVLRQEFEPLFWRTGSVYAMRRDVLMQKKSLYGDDVRGYVIPEERCFNIDSPFDWELCELYMTRIKS